MSTLDEPIRPEFLNRIDEVIMFTPLDEQQIAQIVELQLRSVKKMLHSSGIEMEYTSGAVAVLAQAGYDPEFGARPVKRAIQNLVLNQLSRDIIAHNVDRDRPITIDATGGNITFRN